MTKIIKTLLATLTLSILVNFSYADDNYYDLAIKKFDKKDYDEAKFLLERNIVFNPKDAKSYFLEGTSHNSMRAVNRQHGYARDFRRALSKRQTTT